MRNITFLTVLCICIGEVVFLPIIVEGQMNNGDIEFTSDLIDDLVVKKIILRKKGLFSTIGDSHYFKVAMKQDVEYVARLKITASYGGNFGIYLQGVLTNSWIVDTLSTPVTNYRLEVLYTADGTATGTMQLLYSTSTPQETPSYTLYFNKTGFAGWWWIVLSGIGVLAVFVVLFTFSIIGMISVSKRKKAKGKKKKRK